MKTNATQERPKSWAGAQLMAIQIKAYFGA